MTLWTPPSPLPGPVQTERTVIRVYRRTDARALHEAVLASRAEPWLWLQWVSDPPGLDDCVARIEGILRDVVDPSCRYFSMAVFDRDETTYLGEVSFHHIDSRERTAEVGYWIRSDHGGAGLCTEAAAALITNGFAPQESGGWGFRRIKLLCAVENVASWRVAEKLGLRRERYERAERYATRPTTGYVDSVGYAVLADEWDSKTHRALPGIGWSSFP